MNAQEHRHGDAYDHGRHIKLQLNAYCSRQLCRTAALFRGKLFRGACTPLTALPFCKPGCHADLVTT